MPAALFTTGALVLVTLVVGLAPAIVAAALRGSEGVVVSNRSSDSRATTRLRDGLTIAEVGLAAALVICAGLTLRSLQGLLSVDVGFQTAHRISFKTNLTSRAYPDAERANGFYDQLDDADRGGPGCAQRRRDLLRPDEQRRQRRRGVARDADRRAGPHASRPLERGARPLFRDHGDRAASRAASSTTPIAPARR